MATNVTPKEAAQIRYLKYTGMSIMDIAATMRRSCTTVKRVLKGEVEGRDVKGAK